MNTKVVVNADDFGMNSFATKAILESFQKGWISATTIMPTMPGFEEACEIAHEYNLTDRIGIHFNLTQGEPLSEKIKRFAKFYNNEGKLYKSEKGYFFSRQEKEAIYEELYVQFIKLKNKGIHPTHADSHHHVHHSWGIGMLMAEFCKNYKIAALRLSFNYGKKFGWKRIVYSKLFNNRLNSKGLDKTKYFCEIRQVTPELFNRNKPVEIMVHPIYNGSGHMTNYVGGDDFESLVKKYLQDLSLVSYKELTM